MKALLLSLFTFTMSVTPSQFPVINQADLDGTETFWVQKGGIDYKVNLTNVRQYGGCEVYCTSLVIPTASVLTLFATPLELVEAPGAGYAIEVLSAVYSITFNSIAYATNTKLLIYTDTSTLEALECPNALLSTASQIIPFGFAASGFGTATTVLIDNKSLKVKVETGNPTAGNSDIKIYVHYRIITL